MADTLYVKDGEDIFSLLNISDQNLPGIDERVTRLEDVVLTLDVSEGGSIATVVADIATDVAANTIIELPAEASGKQLTYGVDNNALVVTYNGVWLYKDEHYEEIGESNAVSSHIRMLQELRAGDKLSFQIFANNVGVMVDGASIEAASGQGLSVVVDNETIEISDTGVAIKDPIATGSTTARSLTDRFADAINVKDFGAIGDGMTDDTLAIQAALNLGGEVYLPAGVYAITNRLVVSSNTWLRGAGAGNTTLTILDYDDNGDALTQDYSFIVNYAATQTSGKTHDENIKISDLKILGLSSTRPTETDLEGDGHKGYAIEFFGVKNFTLCDLDIENIPYSAIEIQGCHAASLRGCRVGSSDTVEGLAEKLNDQDFLRCEDGHINNIRMKRIGQQEKVIESQIAVEDTTLAFTWGDPGFGVIVRSGSRNINISNVHGTDVYYGVVGCGQLLNLNCPATEGDNLAQVFNMNVVNCTADCSSAAFSSVAPVFRAAFCRGVSFSNITAVGNVSASGFGIRQAGTTPVQDVQLSNVVVDNCLYGIQISDVDSVPAKAAVYVDNVSINGAHLYNNIRDGIFCGDEHGIKITGVSAHDNDRHGLYFYGTTGMTLSSCVCRNNGQAGTGYGASFRDTQRCMISNLLADDTQDTPTQEYGIRETATATADNPALVSQNMYAGCEASGNVTAQIHLQASGSLLGADLSVDTLTANRADVTKVAAMYAGQATGPALLFHNERARITPCSTINGAAADNLYALGFSSLRFSTVYAATGAIDTSDAREKTNLTNPDEALMRAWSKVDFRAFQFLDAVEKKGENARVHFGVIAQQVAEAFASEGLDASRYALFCHDAWEEEWEEHEDGTKTLITPAGDRYGIRYSEALALECAYQRWRLDKLEAKLNQA